MIVSGVWTRVRLWVAVVVLVVVAAFTTTGCGGDPQRVGGHLRWGETWHDAVAIRVGEPEEFRSSAEQASPRGRESWRAVVSVRNDGVDPYSWRWVRVGATSDGRPQREVLDPFHGCDGLDPGGPVMPGQTVAMVGCWTGGNAPRSVTFTLVDRVRSVTFSD